MTDTESRIRCIPRVLHYEAVRGVDGTFTARPLSTYGAALDRAAATLQAREGVFPTVIEHVQDLHPPPPRVRSRQQQRQQALALRAARRLVVRAIRSSGCHGRHPRRQRHAVGRVRARAGSGSRAGPEPPGQRERPSRSRRVARLGGCDGESIVAGDACVREAAHRTTRASFTWTGHVRDLAACRLGLAVDRDDLADLLAVAPPRGLE